MPAKTPPTSPVKTTPPPPAMDQRNYWKFGYPALMINGTSFVRNPHYHQVTDTIDTLDFDRMTQTVNSAYRGIVGLPS